MSELKEFLESNEEDLICYFGKIDYLGYKHLTDKIEELKKSTDNGIATLVLITRGGDPDYGYRIGRALGHYYSKKLKIFVPSICKSAGTLVVLGGAEIIISDRGELGPLDIQLNNPEEILEMSSGMDLMQSIQTLRITSMNAFFDYLLELKNGASLGTKAAARIASDMATNLVTPILGQIDPSRLGENHRRLNIASSYGENLNQKFKNTSPDNIQRLISYYPSHSYVIDRKEASELFENVRAPNKIENELDLFLRGFRPNLRDLAKDNNLLILSHRDILDLLSNRNSGGTNDGTKSDNGKSTKKTTKKRKRTVKKRT